MRVCHTTRATWPARPPVGAMTPWCHTAPMRAVAAPTRATAPNAGPGEVDWRPAGGTEGGVGGASPRDASPAAPKGVAAWRLSHGLKGAVSGPEIREGLADGREFPVR